MSVLPLLDLGSEPHLPAWLPDETFFSFAGRYHVLAGNRLASQTGLALFGGKRLGYQHDLPSNLRRFIDRAGDPSLTAQSIALDKTILPFYLPLRSPEEARRALASLIDRPDGMLKFRLGILTSRFRGHHPLKACSACMTSDIGDFGTPYWHRTHQFPGVWICPKHGRILKEATVKSTGVDRFGWALPHQDQLRDPVEGEVLVDNFAALRKLASLVAGWVALPAATHLSLLALSETYKSRLLNGRTASPRTKSGQREGAEAYRHAIAPLRIVPELAGLPSTEHQAASQIYRWVFHPRGNTHPLRHLALIYWLYPDWETFWRQYFEMAALVVRRERVESPRAAAPDPRHAAALGLLASGGSASAAAAAVGVDVSTVIAWAARDGVSVARRPKTLKAAKLAAVIADLREGADKKDAAQRHGISVQTVTRLLGSEVGLRKSWQEARFRRRQEQARCSWLAQIAAVPEVGLTVLRAREPAAHAWLYRNDRDWLKEHSFQARLPRARDAGSHVDWDARDAGLSRDVRRAAASVADRVQRDRVELWQIYQAVPELKAKLGALDRLPLTRAAIQAVTRQRRAREQFV